MTQCPVADLGRRRLFWTTQPCGNQVDECGKPCPSYGLKFVDPQAPNKTISTDGFIQSLAVNILLTDGRLPDTQCGYRPGQRGGHWSDSYHQGDSAKAGSLLRRVKSGRTIQETISNIKMQATTDLSKLITYGVASSVDVQVAYSGSNRYALNAVIKGQTGSVTNVGLTGSLVSNSFVWG